MKRFSFLAWLGITINSIECVSAVKTLLASFWSLGLVTLLLSGAGLVLCIQLTKKDARALPKARIQLLARAAWVLLGSLISYFTKPEARELATSNPLMTLLVILISAVINLILWKMWGSDTARKYVGA